MLYNSHNMFYSDEEYKIDATVKQISICPCNINYATSLKSVRKPINVDQLQ